MEMFPVQNLLRPGNISKKSFPPWILPPVRPVPEYKEADDQRRYDRDKDSRKPQGLFSLCCMAQYRKQKGSQPGELFHFAPSPVSCSTSLIFIVLSSLSDSDWILHLQAA